jgi:hypothetical protein
LNFLNQAIDAYAFGPDWGSEMVGGTMTLSMTDLRFDFPGGSIVIPVGRLKAEVRPAMRNASPSPTGNGRAWKSSRRKWNCSIARPAPAGPGAGDVGVPAFEPGIEATSPNPGLLCPGLRHPHVSRKCCAWIHGSIHCPERSPEWDDKFLAMGMEELGVAKDAPSDSNLVAQIETLAAPLLAVVPRPVKGYTFHIVPDPEPNAAALPGDISSSTPACSRW